MVILTPIYFVLLTYYAYKFLTSDGRIVTSPFDKESKVKLDGPEMFWVLTFATGTVALSYPFGIDLMALRLLTIMSLCLIGLKYTRCKPVISFPLVVYFIYMAWIIYGLTYTPAKMYGVRVVLKYLYPLIICLFASAAVDNGYVAVKASLTARWVAAMSLITILIPLIGHFIPGVFWYGTALAINYISMMILSMGLFFFTSEKKKNFLWALFFLFPCFLWVFRTSIMGSGVAIIAFAIIRWRVKSLPVIAAVLIGGLIAVFTIPSLRDKMFRDNAKDKANIETFQKGGISKENIDNNGREAMWDHLEKELYRPNQVFGSGTGATQEYMYTHKLFGGLKVPHGDHVQIKCDNGDIGLVLFIAIAVFIFLHCFIMYWTTDDPLLKLFALVAGASIVGVYATCYSDNTVNYSMATLSMPYGFYGMALGIKRAIER